MTKLKLLDLSIKVLTEIGVSTFPPVRIQAFQLESPHTHTDLRSQVRKQLYTIITASLIL